MDVAFTQQKVQGRHCYEYQSLSCEIEQPGERYLRLVRNQHHEEGEERQRLLHTLVESYRDEERDRCKVDQINQRHFAVGLCELVAAPSMATLSLTLALASPLESALAKNASARPL